MFRKYGLVGILMILFVELNFYLDIEPFARWYFPIIWFGYIFIVDALVYHIKNRSLLTKNFPHFILLLFISAAFWWIFEFVNFRLGNWNYMNPEGATSLSNGVIMATLAFATVLPAIIETMHLVEAMHLWKNLHYKKHLHVTPKLLHGMIYTGLVSFGLVFIIPKFAFPLIWLSLFLILDPFNYMHGSPSLIKHVQQGNWRFIALLGTAGLICGFFWEFWNYWAIVKWHYSIPYLGFLKIFEMPVLGYLGYIPFAWELYAMWHFVRSLHIGKKTISSDASSTF